MFGVVPKTLWEKTNPADENNLCNWSMRCLLIEDGDKFILDKIPVHNAASNTEKSIINYVIENETLKGKVKAEKKTT